MSSIAQTQPRTGRRNFNLRAYLAGTAATAALLGAVVLAFGSLGAYVAFNGLPVGGDDSDASATSISVQPATAPAKADRRQDIAAADVRRDNGSNAAGDSRGSNQPNNGGGGEITQTSVGPAPANPGVSVSGSDNSNSGGSGATATPSPAQTPTSGEPPSATLPTPHVTTPNSVGGTVGQIEQTLHNTGVDVPLSDAGQAVDQVADGLLGN